MKPRAWLTALLLLWWATPASAQQSDGVRLMLTAFENALLTGKPESYSRLVMPNVLEAPASAARASSFADSEFRDGATRAVIQERDRQGLIGALAGNGFRLIVDAFVEFGNRARVATWQLDIRRVSADEWRIVDQERLAAVENLYRLNVNPLNQYDARDFHIQAEDLELTLVEGTVFTITTEQGITGLILLGHGEMRFSPSPDTEKGQVRILTGKDQLESRFDGAYLRFGSFTGHADPEKLVARAVDARDLRRAEQVFREESPKSFVLDMGDLSDDRWSLLPSADDFLAELRTRRFNTLTYARSFSESEDISVFDRRRQRNIAVYPSKEKLEDRGRFYDEDDVVGYDVIGYDIDVALAPERNFISGRTRIRLKTKAPVANQITLRLANSLSVQSVTSDEFGRLFSLKAANQNAVLVNLPASVLRDTEMTLNVIYSGRITPQSPDRETLAFEQQGAFDDESPFPRAEPSQLYSSRTYWYPQSTVSDYATATIRVTVPSLFTCVATGELIPDSPTLLPAGDGFPARRVYEFAAVQPARYLAFLVSRFTRVAETVINYDPATIAVPLITGIVNSSLELSVEANPRQGERGRVMVDRATDIARYYESLLGDSPYPSFALALIETSLPGGHSPAYFAALNQPMPNTPVSWRSDPANFEGFSEFFLAHEMAHQWWGQAVGWQNYHEQWLSEGFAQYFAGLYAKHARGDELFASVLRQWRKWSLDKSDQGPVYLGYRLGHIKNDSRVFRALVYNKGAAVLHMLRGLIGDDAFWRGIRRFYREARFTKAGTEDLRRAMELESGQSLERFFERWIYGSTLPSVSFDFRVETTPSGQEVVLRFEQIGDIFDLPITVTLQYSDRRMVDVLVRITERVVEKRVALDGVLRSAEISREDGAVAEVLKAN
jgi:Peptidase family M1 domain